MNPFSYFLLLVKNWTGTRTYPAVATVLNFTRKFLSIPRWMVRGYNGSMETLGQLLDALAGPSVTTTYVGHVKHETFQVNTCYMESICFSVQSKQIVYHTRYLRPWIPDTHHAIYEVTGLVPDPYRDRVDPLFLATVTYPALCNDLLKWTQYPHILAIHAFIDRIPVTALPAQAVL